MKDAVTGIRVSASKFPTIESLRLYLHGIYTSRERWPRRPVVCVDLAGSKIRVSGLSEISGRKFLDILEGDDIAIVGVRDLPLALGDPTLRNTKIIPVGANVTSLAAQPNKVVFMSDGWLQLRVLEVSQSLIRCRSLHDCRMWDGRGVDIPGMYDCRPSVKSIDPHMFARLGSVAPKIDLFALSFTNSSDDVRDLRQLLSKNQIASQVVAKIETRTGVTNIDTIAAAADAVMIARGDLAVQLAVGGADMLQIEDTIRNVCRRTGRHCIVATRVAESLELGGTTLSEHEIRRLAHELSIGPPLTLMLAQETSQDGSRAEQNYETVVDVISRLLPSYQAKWGSR